MAWCLARDLRTRPMSPGTLFSFSCSTDHLPGEERGVRRGEKCQERGQERREGLSSRRNRVVSHWHTGKKTHVCAHKTHTSGECRVGGKSGLFLTIIFSNFIVCIFLHCLWHLPPVQWAVVKGLWEVHLSDGNRSLVGHLCFSANGAEGLLCVWNITQTEGYIV